MPIGVTGPSTVVDFQTRVANNESVNKGISDYAVGGTGAIPIKQGTYIVQDTAAVAQTLAAPVAGPQDGGGDDGKFLRLWSVSAFAHVITFPANKLNGNKTTATFAAAAGTKMDLLAFQGVWYTTANPSITLT